MKKQKKLIKKLSILVMILIVILAILLGINFNLFESFGDLFKDPAVISIPDNCGVAVGSVIHEIKNEDNCKILCRNECGVRGENFVKVEFNQPENSCYDCKCYCR